MFEQDLLDEGSKKKKRRVLDFGSPENEIAPDEIVARFVITGFCEASLRRFFS